MDQTHDHAGDERQALMATDDRDIPRCLPQDENIGARSAVGREELLVIAWPLTKIKNAIVRLFEQSFYAKQQMNCAR